MSTTATETPGALSAYVIAAILVLGAVGGTAAMGIAGLVMWFVGVTFAVMALMVIVSLPRGAH